MTIPPGRGPPPAQSGFKFGTTGARSAVPPMVAAKKSRAAETEDPRLNQQHHQNQVPHPARQPGGGQYRNGGNRTNGPFNQGDYNREQPLQTHTQRAGTAPASKGYPPQGDSLHGAQQGQQLGGAQYRGGDRSNGVRNNRGYDCEPEPHRQEEASALKRHPSDRSGIHGASASFNPPLHHAQSDEAIVKSEIVQDIHQQRGYPTARGQTRPVQHDPPVQQRPLNDPGLPAPRRSYPVKQSTSAIMDQQRPTDTRTRDALNHQAHNSIRDHDTERSTDSAIDPTDRASHYHAQQHSVYPRDVRTQNGFFESQPEEQVEPAREPSMFESSQVEPDEEESQQRTPYPTQRSTSTFVAPQSTLHDEIIESNASNAPSRGAAGYPSTTNQLDRDSSADGGPPRGRSYPPNSRQADQGSVSQSRDPASIGVRAYPGKSNQDAPRRGVYPSAQPTNMEQVLPQERPASYPGRRGAPYPRNERIQTQAHVQAQPGARVQAQPPTIQHQQTVYEDDPYQQAIGDVEVDTPTSTQYPGYAHPQLDQPKTHSSHSGQPTRRSRLEGLQETQRATTEPQGGDMHFSTMATRMELRLASNEKEMAHLTSANSRLVVENERMDSQVKSLKEDALSLKASIARLEAEKTEEKAAHTQLAATSREQLAALIEKSKKLSADCDTLQNAAKTDILKATIEGLSKEALEYKQRLQNNMNKLKEQTEHIAQLRVTVRDLEKTIVDYRVLERDLSAARLTIIDLRSEASRADTRLKQMTDRFDDLQAQQKTIAKTHEILTAAQQKTINRLSGDVDSANERVRKGEEAYERLNDNMTTLSTSLEAYWAKLVSLGVTVGEDGSLQGGNEQSAEELALQKAAGEESLKAAVKSIADLEKRNQNLESRLKGSSDEREKAISSLEKAVADLQAELARSKASEEAAEKNGKAKATALAAAKKKETELAKQMETLQAKMKAVESNQQTDKAGAERAQTLEIEKASLVEQKEQLDLRLKGFDAEVVKLRSQCDQLKVKLQTANENIEQAVEDKYAEQILELKKEIKGYRDASLQVGQLDQRDEIKKLSKELEKAQSMVEKYRRQPTVSGGTSPTNDKGGTYNQGSRFVRDADDVFRLEGASGGRAEETTGSPDERSYSRCRRSELDNMSVRRAHPSQAIRRRNDAESALQNAKTEAVKREDEAKQLKEQLRVVQAQKEKAQNALRDDKAAYEKEIKRLAASLAKKGKQAAPPAEEPSEIDELLDVDEDPLAAAISPPKQTQTSTKSKTNQGLSEPRAPRGKPKATLNKRKATDDDPIRDFSQSQGSQGTGVRPGPIRAAKKTRFVSATPEETASLVKQDARDKSYRLSMPASTQASSSRRSTRHADAEVSLPPISQKRLNHA